MTGPGRRASLQVVSAQVVAQLSLVAVLPLLTRTYTTTEIGYFQLATAVAMIAQPLATLRSEFAVPSLVSDRAARRLTRIGLATLAGVVALAGVVSLVSLRLGASEVAIVAGMSGLLLAGLGWTAVDSALLIRQGDTNRLAARNLLVGVVSAGAQVTSALVGAGVVMLAASILLGRLVAILLTRRPVTVEDGVALPEPRPYTASRAASSMASGVVATATGQLLVLSAGIGQSASASAYVGVAQRAAGAPLTLLGQGLAQLMQSHIAPLVREHRPGVRARLRKQVVILAAVSAVCAGGLIALAPPLAVPLLGPGWESAGVVVAILAVPLSFQLVVGPLMTVLPLLGRERLLLATQVARFLLVAVTLAVALGLGAGLIATTVAYGIATVAGYVGMLAVVVREAKKFDAAASRTHQLQGSTT